MIANQCKRASYSFQWFALTTKRDCDYSVRKLEWNTKQNTCLYCLSFVKTKLKRNSGNTRTECNDRVKTVTLLEGTDNTTHADVIIHDWPRLSAYYAVVINTRSLVIIPIHLDFRFRVKRITYYWFYDDICLFFMKTLFQVVIVVQPLNRSEMSTGWFLREVVFLYVFNSLSKRKENWPNIE